MEHYIDICAHCNKKVINNSEFGNSDMVWTKGRLEFSNFSGSQKYKKSLELCDYIGGSMTERMYCPDCLLEVITNWVKEIKKIRASKIDSDNIIFDDKIISPCPVCGK